MAAFGSDLRAAFVDLPRRVAKGLWPEVTETKEPLARQMRRTFVLHLHPVYVTATALRVTATFGLGLITATLFIALCVSGALLMIYYVPTTTGALASTLDIQFAVAYGGFVRALHRYTAHGMVLTAFLHLLRVSFTSAYHRRELNWTIGLVLLLLTLALAFTGYLLPWDHLSFWAVTVSSNMLDNIPLLGRGLKRLLLGGDMVGQGALTRFYALHVALLPCATLALMALHLWRIRKDGGLARTSASTEPAMIPAWPFLVLREVIVVLVVLAAFSVLAVVVDAPLGGPPDPHNPANPEKTPWYFLWLQEMVSHSAPVGGVIFPLALGGGMLLLPFLERSEDGVGRWFATEGSRRTLLATFVVAAVALLLLEALFMQPGVVSALASSSVVMRDLLNPATAMLVLALAAMGVCGQLTGSVRTGLLAGLVVLLVAVLGFSVVAACRGPSWIFYWPWEAWPRVD